MTFIETTVRRGAGCRSERAAGSGEHLRHRVRKRRRFDRRTDRRTDGWMAGCTDRPMDQRTNGRTARRGRRRRGRRRREVGIDYSINFPLNPLRGELTTLDPFCLAMKAKCVLSQSISLPLSLVSADEQVWRLLSFSFLCFFQPLFHFANQSLPF